jgi:hypothetical protein
VPDLDSKYRPHLTSELESGEELRGICVASQRQGLEALAAWFRTIDG